MVPQAGSCLLKAAFVAACVLGGTASACAVPIAASGTEGTSVIVGTTGLVTATFQGQSAGYTSLLSLRDTGQTTGGGTVFNNQSSPVGGSVTLGTFEAGTELNFRLFVSDTGQSFFTGAAGGNPDGRAHARVQESYQPNTTLVSFEDLFDFDYDDFSFTLTVTPVSSPIPEPATLALLGTALLGLGLGARRSR